MLCLNILKGTPIEKEVGIAMTTEAEIVIEEEETTTEIEIDVTEVETEKDVTVLETVKLYIYSIFENQPLFAY